MEDSGVTKVIAVRLERSEARPVSPPEGVDVLPEEDVEFEAGSELPHSPPRDPVSSGREGS